MGKSHVAFEGEQTLVIWRSAIIMSQLTLPTNVKKISSPVLRKVVFEEYYFPPTLSLFTCSVILLKGLFVECGKRLGYDFWSQSVPRRILARSDVMASFSAPPTAQAGWLWCLSATREG